MLTYAVELLMCIGLVESSQGMITLSVHSACWKPVMHAQTWPVIVQCTDCVVFPQSSQR